MSDPSHATHEPLSSLSSSASAASGDTKVTGAVIAVLAVVSAVVINCFASPAGGTPSPNQLVVPTGTSGLIVLNDGAVMSGPWRTNGQTYTIFVAKDRGTHILPANRVRYTQETGDKLGLNYWQEHEHAALDSAYEREARGMEVSSASAPRNAAPAAEAPVAMDPLGRDADLAKLNGRWSAAMDLYAQAYAVNGREEHLANLQDCAYSLLSAAWTEGLEASHAALDQVNRLLHPLRARSRNVDTTLSDYYAVLFDSARAMGQFELATKCTEGMESLGPNYAEAAASLRERLTSENPFPPNEAEGHDEHDGHNH
ncbi:hypothetical protein OAX78_00860 [Planctomycetota bacterium]|nr:hypothetical protein [Planctomycetota bacterium]